MRCRRHTERHGCSIQADTYWRVVVQGAYRLTVKGCLAGGPLLNLHGGRLSILTNWQLAGCQVNERDAEHVALSVILLVAYK